MTLIASRPTTTDDGRRLLTTHELALVVRRVASEPRRWRPHVSRAVDAHEVQLSGPVGVEVWLRNWLPAQQQALHDDVLGSWATVLQAPAVRVAERGLLYGLRNDHARPAVTIHAYAPGLSVPAAREGLSTTA